MSDSRSLTWPHTLLESIVNNTQNLVFVRDLAGRFTMVNDAYCLMLGRSRDEILGRTLAEIIPPEAAAGHAANDALVAEGKRPMSFPEQSPDLRRSFLSTKFPIMNAHDAVIAVGTISMDVTDHAAMEATLRESEEKFRLAFNTMPLAININRMSDGRYIDINEGFTHIMGWTKEDVQGRSSLELNIWVDPADRELLVKGLRAEGHVENLRARFRKKNGGVAIGMMSAKILRIGAETTILSVTRDITAEVELEQKYLQAQKMEAVGRLAGGVAHDFNNLLIPITAYAEMVRDTLPEGDERRAMIDEILDASARAANLTRQILAFSRKQVMDMKPVELGRVVRDFQKMITRLVKESIEIHLSICPRDLMVKADRMQVEQILLNLAVNAGDAMPDGGVLSLCTSLEELTGSSNEGFVEAPVPGRYAVLTVSDTGCGMDQATKMHVFEPFFTTKEKGRGTGLGLSTVFGIATQHKGHVWLSSAPGEGTTFKVYLPLCETCESTAAEESEPPAALSGSETILVVEDDPRVGKLVMRALHGHGYTVLFASNGDEALAMAGKGGSQTPQLLLTDVVMPGTDGRALHAALRLKVPGLKVLFMSGYAGSAVSESDLGEGIDLLPKPFTARELVTKVRAVLDKP